MSNEELRKAMFEDRNTPRYRRARLFANTQLSIMRDFIPLDSKIQRVILEYLFELGFKENLTILSVPAVVDALDNAELRLAMITSHPAMLKTNL